MNRTAAAFAHRLLALLLAATLAAPAAAAQVAQQSADPPAKKVLGPDDYGRWRVIQGQQISGNGVWVAYTLRHTNVLQNDSRPVLVLLNLTTNEEVRIQHASNATFSPDSRWVAYQVDSVPVRAGRGGAAAPGDTTAPATPPAPAAGRAGGGAGGTPLRRYELRELASGHTRQWKDIQSASFSATSSHLLLRRRAPGAGAAGGGRAGGPPGPGGATPGAGRGTDAILVELATGRAQLLGSVSEIDFNRAGDMLAYTVAATVNDGNGLFVVDLPSGRPFALDNDTLTYARLTWNDEGNGVAVLKGREVERKRERENVLLVYPNVRAAMQNARTTPARLDPATAANWPKDWVVSERATLQWSDDNRRVFFGAKPQMAAADTARRPSTDSVANVDVWRTQDDRIQSVQMVRADADRNFAFRQAFDVAAGRFIALADSTMRNLEIAPDGRWGVGRDDRAYVSDYEPARADIYRVNLSTGERTLMLRGHTVAGGGALGISADGRNFLYWADERFHAYDLDAGRSRALGGTTAPNFVNTEYDYTGPKPSWGTAGYTPDGRNVIVNDRYDVWLLPLDGGAARNLTQGVGARNKMRLRVVRTHRLDPTTRRSARVSQEIDVTRPVTFSAYGEWNKKGGFYRLAGGRMTEVVYDDAAFSVPERAQNAERYLFTRQTFVQFPDLHVSDGAFGNARRISDANPQQAEYRWGRRVLFDFENRDGKRLQGFVTLPDDYQQGERRPMIVSFYEKNSQNLNRHTIPSFLTGMGGIPIEAVSRGYVFMVPDIHFRTGSSHSDMLEAVEAATKKVIELGYADPARIGVHGHSYGGEGAAFIGTRSSMFAAVGMGAGVTDLYTDFSQNWGWSYQVTQASGLNGNAYYLYGQGRWGFSPWEKPEVYRFESAITHAPNAQAPFLIMHGTADGVVSFNEGLKFYNALRFNGKNAVMLAYPGEGHGLSGLANRRDLTIRYFQFFDHYLRGAPAPRWMTEGVPFIRRDELRDPR